MSQKLKVSIIGRDKLAYEGEAEAVLVPTTTGIIEILPEHMQLVSALQKGELILRGSPTSADIKFKILSGVLEVRPHSEVIILADIEKE